MNAIDKIKAVLADLFSDEEDPAEAGYDPVHLGGAVLITISALGALYWLLWTLLVYEGGLFVKISALLKLAFTRTTLAQLGYEGWPYAPGPFEGVFGNLGALALTIALVLLLRRLYKKPWTPKRG